MRDVQEILNLDLRALRTIQAPDQVQFDPRENKWVPTSALYNLGSDGTISVDLEEILSIDGKPVTGNYPNVDRACGLIAHTVRKLEENKLTTRHTPIEKNDYHGSLTGKPSKGDRRRLIRECEYILPIDGDTARRYEDEKLAKEALRNTTGF